MYLWNLIKNKGHKKRGSTDLCWSRVHSRRLRVQRVRAVQPGPWRTERVYVLQSVRRRDRLAFLAQEPLSDLITEQQLSSERLGISWRAGTNRWLEM